MTHLDPFAPFEQYLFLRRALVACAALSVGGAPLGVLLMLRRMTLVGDTMSHAILPGVGIAYAGFGLALWPMTIGGLLAGFAVALLAGAVTRLTPLKEDASFTGAYLISLAFGVTFMTIRGSTVDLMHVLFGNVLAVDAAALEMMLGVTAISVVMLTLFYRPLVIECFDPLFLRIAGGGAARIHFLFLGLIVLNLVAAFQALGTLMALGLIVLPAITSRFWVRRVDLMMAFSVAAAWVSSVIGLLLSYYRNLPSGPAIVLVAGSLYLFSLLFGTQGGVTSRFYRHFAAGPL